MLKQSPYYHFLCLCDSNHLTTICPNLCGSNSFTTIPLTYVAAIPLLPFTLLVWEKSPYYHLSYLCGSNLLATSLCWSNPFTTISHACVIAIALLLFAFPCVRALPLLLFTSTCVGAVDLLQFPSISNTILVLQTSLPLYSK